MQVVIQQIVVESNGTKEGYFPLTRLTEFHTRINRGTWFRGSVSLRKHQSSNNLRRFQWFRWYGITEPSGRHPSPYGSVRPHTVPLNLGAKVTPGRTTPATTSTLAVDPPTHEAGRGRDK
jgi:hypothetical protein